MLAGWLAHLQVGSLEAMRLSTHLSLGRDYLRELNICRHFLFSVDTSKTPSRCRCLTEYGVKTNSIVRAWEWEGNQRRQSRMDTTSARSKFCGHRVNTYCVQDYVAYYGEDRNHQTWFSSVTDTGPLTPQTNLKFPHLSEMASWDDGSEHQWILGVIVTSGKWPPFQWAIFIMIIAAKTIM